MEFFTPKKEFASLHCLGSNLDSLFTFHRDISQNERVFNLFIKNSKHTENMCFLLYCPDIDQWRIDSCRLHEVISSIYDDFFGMSTYIIVPSIDLFGFNCPRDGFSVFRFPKSMISVSLISRLDRSFARYNRHTGVGFGTHGQEYLKGLIETVDDISTRLMPLLS